MTHGYILVGRATKGKFTGQLTVIGTVSENSLAKDREQIEDYLARARKFAATLSDPDIDPESIEIAEVGAPGTRGQIDL